MATVTIHTTTGELRAKRKKCPWGDEPIGVLHNLHSVEACFSYQFVEPCVVACAGRTLQTCCATYMSSSTGVGCFVWSEAAPGSRLNTR